MPDLRRAYRRWALRNGLMLGVAWTAAAAVAFRVLAAPEVEVWARVAGGSVALLGLGLLTALSALLAACARLQARGRRAEARTLRRQLRPSGRLAAGTLGVLVFLACVPWAFLKMSERGWEPARPGRVAVRVRKSRLQPKTVASVPIPPEAADPKVRAELTEARTAAPIPEIRPLLEGLPPRVILEETPAERSAAAAAAAPEPDRGSEAAAGDEEERGLPAFRLTEADLERFPEGSVEALVVDRRGRPREDDPEAPLYVEGRVDVLLLSMDGYRPGAAAALEVEVPLERWSALRGAVLTAAFMSDEHLEDVTEDGASFSGIHATLEYVLKILGYTRRAPLDLAVGVGLAADRFASREGPERAEPVARFSPWFSVEAGFWQAGMAGFVVRAGQSIPANLTGATASLTDLTGLVRLDLSERLSIHAGYRLVRVRLRDYGRALALGGGTEEVEETLSGPLLGLDVRF